MGEPSGVEGSLPVPVCNKVKVVLRNLLTIDCDFAIEGHCLDVQGGKNCFLITQCWVVS